MLTKSWTKNADQIKKIEETLHAPIFADARWLAVQYLTRADIVREVLPPPLEPAAQPSLGDRRDRHSGTLQLRGRI